MNRLMLFPTPVFTFDVPAMEATNAAIAALLLEEQNRDGGVSRSNVGGWHSAPTLTQRPEAAMQKLMRAAVDHVGLVMKMLAEERKQPLSPLRWSVHAWAMIMRDGDYTTLHDHGDSHWSLVYYVDAGDAADRPESGVLTLVDPRRGGRTIPGMDLFPCRFEVHPRDSLLVVFPGWLQHFVHTYRGARPRICVSANLTLLD